MSNRKSKDIIHLYLYDVHIMPVPFHRIYIYFFLCFINFICCILFISFYLLCVIVF